MKIFSWMQSKLNVKQVARKPNAVVASYNMGQATLKEEFSDWPQSLLAIGTFGISTLKADPERESSEEVGELIQEELISFLDVEESESVKESEAHEAPCEELVNRDICVQRSISGMSSRGMKGILVDHKNVIRKKSLTFLLKKFFTSRNRFNHINDSLHPTIDKSRMEKILRAVLNKKIHPQSSASKPLPNKYLVSQDTSMDDEISETEDDYEGSSTWVKTDSEYIVLEI
ncbi:protein DEEPER ROOTING 1 [Lactuca sativa]|uniref:protein DEEPER ROOTING 1 n=1 Tax=Lactuca sativa TaxID=4236 RepID=UPI000CAF0FA4|nr:protein DEEPER ROOTING 1 [Lactuca sativa]XP_042751339.1 protein DEEPER ROOTING 1 [Lactuca sativa]